MRSLLLASTMAALASTATLAAEPLSLKVNGKLRHFFSVADQDNVPPERLSRAGMFTDAEIYFDAKTVLDNGVEVRAIYELEAETRPGDNADEVYVDFVTGFGRFRIGEKEGLSAAMIGEPVPEAFLTTEEEIIGDVLRARNGVTAEDAFTFKRYAGDVLGLSYETPALIRGVKLGITYHPQTSTREGPFDRTQQEHDAIDMSGRYEGRFRGGGYRLAAGYFHSNSRIGGNDGNKGLTFHAGVTYGGWDFGGSYATSDPATGIDERAWGLGLLYSIGPVRVSVNHFSGRRDTLPVKEKSERTTAQGAYRVGPGITLGLSVFYADQRTGTAVKFDGLGALAGVKLAL